MKFYRYVIICLILLSGFMAKAQEVHIKQIRVSTYNYTFPEVGQIIRLPAIYHHPDSSHFEWDNLELIDSVAAMIKLNPDLVWEVGSYTNCHGLGNFLDKLSLDRSNEIIRVLREKDSVPADQLIAKGYGMRLPLFNCDCDTHPKEPRKNCTDAQDKMNERTELRLAAIRNGEKYAKPVNTSKFEPALPQEGQFIRLYEPVVFAEGNARMITVRHSLDSVIDILKKHPKKKFIITVHLDCQTARLKGADTLWQKRADAIRSYMASHGMRNRNLSTQMAGTSKPLADCPCEKCTAVQNAYNRRIEIVVGRK